MLLLPSVAAVLTGTMLSCAVASVLGCAGRRMLHSGTRLCELQLTVAVAAADPVAVISITACQSKAVLRPGLPRDGCAAATLLVQTSPGA